MARSEDVGARILAGDPLRSPEGMRFAVDRQRQLQGDPRPASLSRLGSRHRLGASPAPKPMSTAIPALSALDPLLLVGDRVSRATTTLASQPRLSVASKRGRDRSGGRRVRGWCTGRPRRQLPAWAKATASAWGRPPGWVAPSDDLAPATIRSRHWIGSGAAANAVTERDCLLHEAIVVAHMPSCFSSFWNWRCFSFCAASLAAWSIFC